jgi:anti-sigma factor RsiW
MSHPSQDELLEFTAGLLPESEAETVYTHLDACAPCAERCEAIQRIRADFEGSWSEFLQEFRARFEAVGEIAPATVEPAFDVVLRGVIDGTRRLATAALDRVTGVLQDLSPVDVVFRPAYAGIGDPEKTGRAGRFSEEASVLCAEGKEAQALTMLAEASRLDPRAGASATLDLMAGGQKIGEVIVDAARRSVSVVVDLDRLGGAGGSALLRAASSEQRFALEPVEGARYALAEFEDVPNGPFSVGLELEN